MSNTELTQPLLILSPETTTTTSTTTNQTSVIETLSFRQQYSSPPVYSPTSATTPRNQQEEEPLLPRNNNNNNININNIDTNNNNNTSNKMLSFSSDDDDLGEFEFTYDDDNNNNKKDSSSNKSNNNNNNNNNNNSCTSELTLAVKYTATDISSRPRNFTIGFCSTFVVVFFVGLILVGISKTPVIFLRFAETSVGEMDALLLAAGSSPFLNYTQVKPKIEQSSLTTGSAPRWLLRGQLYPEGATPGTTPTTTLNISNSSDNNSSSSTTTTTNFFAGTSILVGDTLREKDLGIGRGWPYRPIGYSEAQVLDTVLHFLKITPNIGDRSVLNVDVAGILRQQGIDPTEVTGGLLGGGGAAVGPGGVPIVPATNTTAPPLQPNATVTIPGVNGTNATDITVSQLFAGLAGLLTGTNLTLNQSDALVNAASGFVQTNVNGTPQLDLNALLAGLTVPDAAAVSEQLLSPTFGLTVADAFDDPYGKYPSTLGNMLILDQRYLVRMLIDQLCYETLREPLPGTTVPGLPPAAEIEETIKLEHFTLIVVAMMKDRYNTYYSSTLVRTQKIIRFSNDLFRALGLGFGGSAQYPIAIALVAFDFFSLFLNSLFSSVVAVVIVMGFLLVYTLLLTNTEERSFEVAMLRAQGMNKVQLLLLLASQSTAFIVPAIALAVAVLLTINAILELLLSGVTLAPADTARIDVTSIVFPVCIGITIPAIANYRPALGIMSTSLRDALSMYRHAANETTVTVMKLAELGLAPWQTLVGWLLVIGGFIVYYLVPLSFLINRLEMFFVLMNIILLGMLIGLCLICFTIQERVENAVLWCLLWGKDKCLSMLVQKNLSAHSDRNGKAFLMFTITSAVLIFGGALFVLLAVSISDTVRVVNGADINVQSLVETAPLNTSLIDELLTQEKLAGRVKSWSYATFSLNDFPQITQAPIAELATVIGFPDRNLQVQGISDNFLETVFPQFVILNSKDENVAYPTVPDQEGAKPDFIRSLTSAPPISVYEPVGEIYTGYPPNSTRPNILIKYKTVIPIVVASSAQSVLGLDAGSAATIGFDYKLGIGENQENWGTVFLANARALVDKLSGFPTMTSLQIAFQSSLVLTNFDGIRSLLRANEFDFGREEVVRNPNTLGYASDAVLEPLMGRMWIRLDPGMSKDERSDFANRLRLVLNPYFHLAIDTNVVVDSVQTAADLILYFFYFVSVIAIILDTFMLWLTFISNIQLNAWSVGVLRSLGFTQAQVTRAYVYESLVLVLSSFVCGVIIGTTIAATVVLQMSLLLTIPFTFLFPYELFFFLLALSLMSAFAASIIPARQINKKAVSAILKSG